MARTSRISRISRTSIPPLDHLPPHPSPQSTMPDKEFHFLRKQDNWKDLYFYRKSEVLYLLAFRFTKRFLKTGDRTIDQMVQAARSGKQNIIEGFSAGVASTETEVKLLNVARSSIQELQEDFKDYLTARLLPLWDNNHPRFRSMLEFTKSHNDIIDYETAIEQMTDEELANLGYTLCRQVDRMMSKFLNGREHQFVEQGGIRERMTAARLGRRQTQNETIEAQAHEIQDLRTTITTQQARIAELEAELRKWHVWWKENKPKFQESKGQQEQQET